MLSARSPERSDNDLIIIKGVVKAEAGAPERKTRRIPDSAFISVPLVAPVV
jgi:hypothetical protein